MKSLAAIIAVLTAFSVTSVTAHAQETHGTCDPGSAEAFLDVNDVRAKILNNGGLFWNGGQPVYEVPVGSGWNPILASSIWLGGHVGGELGFAGTMFGPYEFWPGPIPAGGGAPSDCSGLDALYELRYDEDLVAASNGTFTDAVVEWPADLGAPFDDLNGQPGYQPEAGDRPLMLGDQSIFWVMNDRGNEHLTGKTHPLGVEVRGTAFAFDDPDLATTTFYRYEVTNRNESGIEDLFIGLISFADMEINLETLVGSDSTLGMVYVYHEDVNPDVDDNPGYGDRAPAMGFVMLESSHEVNDDYGRASGAVFPGFNHTMTWTGSGAAVNGEPGPDGLDFYRYMGALWKDGESLTVGGQGRDASTSETTFIYPGDPVSGGFWSALNLDGTGTVLAGARGENLGSFGPVDLAAGETYSATIAIVWARGESHLDSVTKLKENVRAIRSRTTSLLTKRNGEPTDADGHPGSVSMAAELYPNPSTSGTTLRLSMSMPSEVRIDVFDMLGRHIHHLLDARVDAGSTPHAIPTADWPAGVYLVRMQLDHITETRRLVVTR